MKNPVRRLTALTFIAVLVLLACTASGEEKRYDIPLDHAVFLGPADAPITMVEFLDFQ